MNKITSCSESDILTMDSGLIEDYFVISISDSGRKVDLKNFYKVLHIDFFDYSFEKFKKDSYEYYNSKFHLFDQNDAKTIIDYVDENEKDYKELIIHCTAGISRSTAVAMFLSGKYNVGWFHKNYIHPNMTIYRELINYQLTI